MAESTIEFCEITKYFGEITVNDHVSFSLKKGKILAFFGESRSDKTALMSTPSGIYFPDDGWIKVDGEIASVQSPKGTFRLGIGTIYQHFKLIPVFSVAENTILDEQGGKYGLQAAKQKLLELAGYYGFHLNPKQRVYELSVPEKQAVEIMKVLYRGTDILILDEPTAVLTPQETERLLAILRKMWEGSKSILIITHKLTGVPVLSDHIAVLRRGQYIGTAETAGADVTLLAGMMVGEKVKLGINRAAPLNGPGRLHLESVTCANAGGAPVLPNLSLILQGGEIPGITGIVGNGQWELLEAIAGLMPYSGEIYYEEDDGSEKGLEDMTPAAVEALGVRLAFVPEDRLGMDLVGSMDLTNNMMLRSYRNSASFVTDRRKPEEQAEQIVEELSVMTPGTATPIGRFLGDNVQKVLVGREILGSSKIVMTVYPMRGLDIHPSYIICRLLNEQKKKGSAAIYVDEGLDVLLELCNRILVLQGGRSARILGTYTASKEELERGMMGGEGSEV